MVHSLAPSRQHPLSGVLKAIEAIHHFANSGDSIHNRVTDSFHH
jgi:hypothetical protein